MAQTIVEKVLSRAAGKDGLRSVEIAVGARTWWSRST